MKIIEPGYEIMGARDAAKLLLLSEDCLRELARKGEVPGQKAGKRYRYSRAALLAWLARHCDTKREKEARKPKVEPAIFGDESGICGVLYGERMYCLRRFAEKIERAVAVADSPVLNSVAVVVVSDEEFTAMVRRSFPADLLSVKFSPRKWCRNAFYIGGVA